MEVVVVNAGDGRTPAAVAVSDDGGVGPSTYLA